MGRSRVSSRKMGKNSQMKIKRKNNTSSVIMSNQNIFTAIEDRINAKNLEQQLLSSLLQIMMYSQALC